MNSIQKAQQLGQAMWLDFIRRGMFASGEFKRYIETGITGVTSNPTIFEKAIGGSTDYDDALRSIGKSNKKTMDIYESLAIEDIRSATDMLRPVYDRTGRADGYVSLEVNPQLAFDTRGTIAEARRLFKAVDRPNLMIKVPATPEGIPAIRDLIGEGINVNATLIFSLGLYTQVREAYVAGLEDLARKGGDVSKVGGVASFFVSRVDTSVDAQLQERIKKGQEDLKPLLGKAAVANAKLAYQAYRETFESKRFAALKSKGARVQRPLWASTSTKNPAYSDVLYVEPLIGVNTVNTLPPETIKAFLDHGHAEITIERDAAEARQTMEGLAKLGIDIDSITSKLLADGVKSFADSFEKLLTGIEKKRQQISAK
ncbi:MAG: transaldolase [Chloroflexi bacterium]|nr:transaldolase [Chloroflexota bacterium]